MTDTPVVIPVPFDERRDIEDPADMRGNAYAKPGTPDRLEQVAGGLALSYQMTLGENALAGETFRPTEADITWAADEFGRALTGAEVARLSEMVTAFWAEA